MKLFQFNRKQQNDLSEKSVVILTPCKDHEVSAKFAKSVANMVAYSWSQGLKVWQMGISERMVVHWGRNHLAKQANEMVNEYTGHKFTHVLWLDDDHVFNPDLAVRLASHDVDIVSALYFARTGSPLPVAYVKDPEKQDERYTHYTLFEPPTTLVEADAVGFGAVLMRREIFDAVPYPWFSFDEGCGEDIYFCVNAKEAGFRIWLDGEYRLGHIGSHRIVTEADYQEHMQTNADRYADRKVVQF